MGVRKLDPNNPSDTQAMMDFLNETYNGGGPKRIGLVVLMFEYGESQGQANYISNGANREDIVKLMDETAKRLRMREDMIHLPYAMVNVLAAHTITPEAMTWEKQLSLLGVKYEDYKGVGGGQVRLTNVKVPRVIKLPSWVTHPPIEQSEPAPAKPMN